MAVKAPAFRRKFPLLVTSSLIALSASPLLHADDQFNCRADSSGRWNCASESAQRPAPRPQQSTAPEHRPAPVRSSVQQKPAAPAPTAARPAPTAAQPAAAQRPQPADNPYAELDWVPREQLTAEQLAEISPWCSGDYIEPPRSGSDESAKDSPTFLSARASRYDQQNQIATLAGDVVMRQGSIQAEADEANFYQQQSRGQLRGNVRLRDRGMLIGGQRAELDMQNGEAEIENAYYVAHKARARGEADYIKRNQDALILLKGGTYTRCEPGDNAWKLKGNNIKLDQASGFGTATNVTLRVKDVPVFYTPYMYFPIDDRRQSGFLAPSITSSGDTGATIKTPYYFNLAPDYDATLYPTWMANRGLLMEGEFRYLGAGGEGQIGGAWLNDQEDERQLQSEYSDQRWLFSWQHDAQLNSRLVAELDYTSISDPYYFQDLDTDLGIDTPSYLDQKASLSWYGDSYTASIKAHAYELATVTEITPYSRLPQLSLEGRLPVDAAGLVIGYNTEFVRFDRSLRNGNFIDESGAATPWYDTRINGLARSSGDRLHVAPRLSLPMDASWGYLTPAVKYSWTRYDLDIDQQGLATLLPGETFRSSQDRGIPLYSLDSGLYFEREGSRSTQTLEPRAMYLYVPETSQNDIPVFDTTESPFSYETLWRDNRFAGKDRVGDENRLSLGLTSRWIESNGFERQRISFGQALYFADRKVQMPGIDYRTRSDATSNQSPYAAQYQYRMNADWRLSAEFNWDGDSHTTRSGSTMFHYQPVRDPNKVVNFGYRYRNDIVHYDRSTGTWVAGNSDFGTPGTASYIEDYYKISQHDISTIWPVIPQWSVIARWQYDYNRNRTLEAFGGFEYDSCCWKVRLVSRYWVDYSENSLNPALNDEADNGIFLQIVFKGLGGITGNKVESFLDQGIQGYRQREDQAF